MGPFSPESFTPGSFSIGSFSPASLTNGPFSGSDSQAALARFNGPAVDKDAAGKVPGQQAAENAASSTLSSLNRGQGLISVMGDDWRPVEAQLQSRQEHFPRFQM